MLSSSFRRQEICSYSPSSLSIVSGSSWLVAMLPGSIIFFVSGAANEVRAAFGGQRGCAATDQRCRQLEQVPEADDHDIDCLQKGRRQLGVLRESWRRGALTSSWRVRETHLHKPDDAGTVRRLVLGMRVEVPTRGVGIALTSTK